MYYMHNSLNTFAFTDSFSLSTRSRFSAIVPICSEEETCSIKCKCDITSPTSTYGLNNNNILLLSVDDFAGIPEFVCGAGLIQ